MDRINHPAPGLLSGLAPLFLTLLAGPALAQQAPQDWRGLYVGGGGAYSNVSVEVDPYDDCCDWWGDYAHYDDGDGAYGWSLHLGWRLHRYVALEAGYLDTGGIDWDENLVYMPGLDGYYDNRVRFSAEIAEISVLGILPFADIVEIYLRLGAGLWEGVSEQQLGQSFGPAVLHRRTEESGTGLLAGVGIGVSIAKALHLRLDLQSVTLDEDVLNARDDTSLESLLLEVQYRFGAR
jgi:hypothetical protein